MNTAMLVLLALMAADYCWNERADRIEVEARAARYADYDAYQNRSDAATTCVTVTLANGGDPGGRCLDLITAIQRPHFKAEQAVQAFTAGWGAL